MVRRTPIIYAIALILFLISGVAALFYQVSWTRQMGGLLGNTVHTTAYVLFSFMMGMSIGYWISGRKCTERPLLWYGLFELTAAAWAFVVPLLLRASASTFLAGIDSGPLNFYALARIAFCFLVLSPATVCLGATWPMIVRFLSSDSHKLLPWSYAINTVGAILGSLFGTTVLLVAAGVVVTSYIGAVLSTLCGISAVLLSRFSLEKPVQGSNNARLEQSSAVSIPSYWWCLVAMSGGGILALEVLYLRLFSLVFHNSAYSYGLTIAIFLLALALGSVITKFFNTRIPATSLAAFACTYGGLCIGLSVIAFVYVTNFSYFVTNSFQFYLLKGAGLVAGIVLPPVILLGIILPVSWRAMNEVQLSAKQISNLTALSTLSGAVGALCASFILPRLGLWMSFGLVASVFLGAGVLLFIRQRQRLHLLILVVSLIVIGLVCRDVVLVSSTLKPGDKLLQRWETAYGWIDLISEPDNSFQIRQNLHYGFGSTTRSVRRDYRQGHIPLLLHRDARSVLFLGMGTGQTASAALSYEQLKSITVCELIPEAVEAARGLETNRGLLNDPRVNIQIGDARKFLRDSGNQYDVIVSDLFVPWESHTGYLYTVEQYRAGLRALGEGGLFCQWLPLYQLGSDDFEIIANSFATVFPCTTLWWAELDTNRAVVGLIGSRAPLDFFETPAAQGKAGSDPLAKKYDVELSTGNGILSLYLGDWQSSPSVALNTEEYPRIEFSAPIHHVNNSKLRGRRLENYFDYVLAELSSDNLLCSGKTLPMTEKKARIQFQRVEMLK